MSWFLSFDVVVKYARSWQVWWGSWWPFESLSLSLSLSLSFSLLMSDCFSSSSCGQSFCQWVFFFCLMFPLICLHPGSVSCSCLLFTCFSQRFNLSKSTGRFQREIRTRSVTSSSRLPVSLHQSTNQVFDFISVKWLLT